MTNDWWLSKNQIIGDDLLINMLLSAGEYWQIYETNNGNKIVVVDQKLANKWVEFGLIEESLMKRVNTNNKLLYIQSQANYSLRPVDRNKIPVTKIDALAFIVAMRETRKIIDDVSLHDAIYFEQYSRLLPTWTLSPSVQDNTVLGIWLTGGVNISTDSFRRLSNLTSYMNQNDLLDIIKKAGFDPPKFTSPEINELDDIKKIKQGAEFRLPGRPNLESFFNEHIIEIIQNAERYSLLGINFPSAIVLHGPPGCGKTYAVERLVEFLDWPYYSIDSNSIGSPFIHDTSKKIAEVFDKAIESAPAIVVIDEMESYLSDRSISAGTSSMYHVEEVAEFLRRIPEAINNKVLIIAMTNMIEIIDPAILRRGRFDHIIEVGMPSRIEVEALVDSLLNKLPVTDDLKKDCLIDTLTGRALSDSAFIVREAARLAAKSGKSVIDQDSIEKALLCISKDNDPPQKNIGFLWDS